MKVSTNITFASPATESKTAVADPALAKASPAFGLALAPSKDGNGVLVTDVDPNGVGAEKGIGKGDIILEISGKQVVKPSDVRTAIDEARKEGRKAVVLRLKGEDGMRFVALAFPKG